VRDAEWITQLLEDGLSAPSFAPPPEIRRLRMLTRHRMQLLADRTKGGRPVKADVGVESVWGAVS
jgi:transposase